MTGPLRVEADGTRVYRDYHRYRPVALEDRVYAVRRPKDPRAVRFGGTWFLPLELLADDRRRMPETRPDDQTLSHRATCRCEVCQRPQALILWRRRARQLRAATPESSPPRGRPPRCP